MRAMSPQRRLSITRNTNYPSLVHERRPSELGYQSNANMKSMSQDHDANRNRMEKIHMKSITELDNQRKLLEKSMVAYTEKMKEMMDHRTNHLFRGIQIRLADTPDKTGPRSLPASVDLCDTTSTVPGSSPVDSAKLRRRRILVSRKSGILTERHEIKTPIDEEREVDIKQTKPSRRTVRPNSANLWRKSSLSSQQSIDNISISPRVRYSSPDIFTTPVKHQLTGRRFSKAIEEENENVNYKLVELEIRSNVPDHFKNSASSSNNNSAVNSAGSQRKSANGDILTTPTIHIQNDSNNNVVFPGLQRERSFVDGLSNDSDSAYSSCNEEDDGWTTADSGSVSDCGSDNSNKSGRKVRFVDPNPLDGNLLTVPKVFKRKRNNKGKLAEKENSDTLLKKAILKNATSKS